MFRRMDEATDLKFLQQRPSSHSAGRPQSWSVLWSLLRRSVYVRRHTPMTVLAMRGSSFSVHSPQLAGCFAPARAQRCGCPSGIEPECRCDLYSKRARGQLWCRGQVASTRYLVRSLGPAVAAAWCSHASLASEAEALASITLELKAPLACPTRDDLIERLRHDLRDSRQQGSRLAAYLNVEQLGIDRWRALLSIQSDHGSNARELSAASCDAIFDATSVIVATTFDPELALADAPDGSAVVPNANSASASDEQTHADSSRLPSSASDARPAVSALPKTKNQERSIAAHPTQSRVNPQPRASGAPNWEVLGALEAAVDLGSLPSPTPALRGLIGLDHGSFRAEGRAGWWWAREATSNAVSSPGAGGRFSLFAADVRLCVNALEQGRFRVYPCAGFELDRWHGEGNATLVRKASATLWGTSVDGAALFTLDLGHNVALRGNLETAIPLNPPAFGFQENGVPVEVFRPGRIAVRVGGGFELHFR